MALPTTGTISLGLVRTELKRSDRISLGDTDVRTLASKPSGMISLSDLRGKSAGGPPIFLNHTLKITWITDDWYSHTYTFNMAGSAATSFTAPQFPVDPYTNAWAQKQSDFVYVVYVTTPTSRPFSITVTASNAHGSVSYRT